MLAALCAALGVARGQDATPQQLGPVVVTATRLPEDSGTVGTDVVVIPGADLARQQFTTLEDALSGVPTGPIFATGQAGASASIFLRGANSDQTLFLVDGMRLNDANVDYGPFLGGARIFSTDRIEVALGPQSTLYGSGAAGGVVSLTSQKGTGAPTETLAAEAGSFGTEAAAGAAQGTAGAWAYNLAVSGSHTDNTRINNAFDSDDLALRVDWAAGTNISLGATLRGFISRYDDPSDEFTNDPAAYEKEKNWLATIFADVKWTQYITSHITFGGQDRRFTSVDPSFGDDSLVHTQRGSIDWQNTVQLTASNRLVAGVTAEDETDLDTGFGNINRGQTLFALYGEDEWNPLDNLYLTGGLRRDDYDTFGPATTGRLTAALLVADRVIKLRGSYGTGFNAPSFLDLYGLDVGYVGNPALRPERSDGWDMGADLYVPGTQQILSATWFQTDFRDLITDNFAVDPATTENIDRARTRGVELALKTVLAGAIQTKLAYTRLEATDLLDDTSLLRRPHYEANADLWYDFGHGLTAGVGGGWVGTRADVDAQTFAAVNDPGYFVARAYAAYQISASLTFRVRVENALNKPYEPVNGYPALGRGIFGSAEWKF